LVVGSAADDACLYGLHHVVGQGATERAGGIDVHRGRGQGVDVEHVDLRMQQPHPIHRVAIDVGDDDGRAVVEQVLDQVVADLADPGAPDPAAAQGGGA